MIRPEDIDLSKLYGEYIINLNKANSNIVSLLEIRQFLTDKLNVIEKKIIDRFTNQKYDYGDGIIISERDIIEIIKKEFTAK